jgi:hypothetical protein
MTSFPIGPLGPNQPPEDALPPNEVRITELRAEPWPGGQRIKVLLQLTPFRERPNLTATILAPGGEEVAGASVIETNEEQIVFTLHIRAELQPGPYTLALQVEYPDLGVVDRNTVDFDPLQAA